MFVLPTDVSSLAVSTWCSQMQFWVSAVLLLATSATQSPVPSDGAELSAIQSIDEAFPFLDNVELIVREDVRTNRSSDGATQEEHVWFRIRKNGERAAILMKRRGDTWLEGKLTPYAKLQEFVVAGQGVQINCTATEQPDAVDLHELTPSVKSYTVLGSLDGGPTIGNVSWVGYLRGAKTIFGYVDGDNLQSLREIMRNGSVHIENSGESSEMCLLCESEYGPHRVWLDAGTRHVTKIAVEKSGENLLGDKPVRLQPEVTKSRRIWPEGRLVGFGETIRDIAMGEHDGLPYIRAYTSERVYHYSTGDDLTFVSNVNVESVVPLPPAVDEQMFRPSLPLPEGTEVHVNGSPNIRYVWKNRAIVADDAPGAFKGVDALRHNAPDSGARRLLVWGNLILLVVIGVGLLVARRRQA